LSLKVLLSSYIPFIPWNFVLSSSAASSLIVQDLCFFKVLLPLPLFDYLLMQLLNTVSVILLDSFKGSKVVYVVWLSLLLTRPSTPLRLSETSINLWLLASLFLALSSSRVEHSVITGFPREDSSM
jgi:hypothetical protein